MAAGSRNEEGSRSKIVVLVLLMVQAPATSCLTNEDIDCTEVDEVEYESLSKAGPCGPKTTINIKTSGVISRRFSGPDPIDGECPVPGLETVAIDATLAQQALLAICSEYKEDYDPAKAGGCPGRAEFFSLRSSGVEIASTSSPSCYEEVMSESRAMVGELEEQF